MTATLSRPASQPAKVPSSRKIRLRSWDTIDGLELAGALTGSFAATWLVYEELTPLTGGLGFFVCWTATFFAIYWLMVRQRLGKLQARDRLAAALVTVIGLVLVVSLIQILAYVIGKGYHALRPTFFTKDQFGVGPLSKPTDGGGLAAIVGTVEQVGLATIISVPLGISTAVFLNEVKGRWARPVRILTDAMSGIPSILAGLFIYAVLIYSHILPESGFAVSLALAISMLPTVTRTSEVVLRLVPSGLREASLALGGTEWRTVRRVVLPAALTGLVTASILGIARVVGEAAPAIIDAGGSSKVNYNPFKGQQDSLPLMIYNDIRTFVVNEHARAWTAGAVLLLLILILFVFARVIGARQPGRTARVRLPFLFLRGPR